MKNIGSGKEADFNGFIRSARVAKLEQALRSKLRAQLKEIG